MYFDSVAFLGALSVGEGQVLKRHFRNAKVQNWSMFFIVIGSTLEDQTEEAFDQVNLAPGTD
jgi:hypothetical protein